jgi:uncharacterized membrane protein YbhN (UPF0104 family)
LQFIEPRLDMLLANLRLAGQKPGVIVGVFLTVLLYFLIIAVIYIGFFEYAADQHAALFPTLAGLASIGILSNIPLTINGVGLREQLHFMFFAPFGFSKELAVGISLLIFSYFLVLSVVGYIFWFRLQIMSRRAALESPTVSI